MMDESDRRRPRPRSRVRRQPTRKLDADGLEPEFDEREPPDGGAFDEPKEQCDG